MNGLRILPLALLLLFSITGCETTNSSSYPSTHAQIPDGKELKGATFEIQYPDFVNVASESADEYTVHYLRLKGSHSQLGIYEGQRPTLFYPKEKDLTIMQKGSTHKENISVGEDLWGVDSHAMQWRESVWSCIRTVHSPDGKTYRLPSVLHIWYFGASEEEKTLFDSMISTIEMLK